MDIDEEKNREDRVFCVIGSTGSRKSQVAVYLAKFLERVHKLQNVIIINCDVPQFYDGLPIATNKAKKSDLEGIPHFFLGFLDRDGTKKFAPEQPYPHEESPLESVGEERYNVTHYQKEAVKFIDEHFLKNKNTAVIVCGGTCYYAQSILFCNTLADDRREGSYGKKVREEEYTKLWDRLNIVDPELAARYHPHDTRRIQRLLEIYREKGVPPSQLFASKSNPLRYPHSYVIWSFIERPVLDVELAERVEKMVERGLVLEVHEFSLENRKKNNCGAIMECIGYKEFEGCQGLLETPPNSSVIRAIANIKSNTCRYARQQLQFIQNRLAPMLSKGISSPIQFIKFDVTNPSNIQEGIKIYSENVLFNQNNRIETVSFPGDLKDVNTGSAILEKCAVCDVLVYGRDQLSLHTQSKRHRGALKRQRIEKEQWEKYGRVLPPPRKKS